MTTPPFEPRVPIDFPELHDRVRDSFARQGDADTLGPAGHLWRPVLWTSSCPMGGQGDPAARLSACGHGCHGAGFAVRLCGLHPDGEPTHAVLTIEFKINFLLAPAKGERFRMEGRVLKPGRTITVCEGRAFAIDGRQEKLDRHHGLHPHGSHRTRHDIQG